MVLFDREGYFKAKKGTEFESGYPIRVSSACGVQWITLTKEEIHKFVTDKSVFTNEEYTIFEDEEELLYRYISDDGLKDALFNRGVYA